MCSTDFLPTFSQSSPLLKASPPTTLFLNHILSCVVVLLYFALFPPPRGRALFRIMKVEEGGSHSDFEMEESGSAITEIKFLRNSTDIVAWHSL